MTRKEIRDMIAEAYPGAVLLTVADASRCLGVEWHTGKKTLEGLPWFEIKKGQKSYSVKDIADYLYLNQRKGGTK